MPTDKPPLSRSFTGPLTKVVAEFVIDQMRRMEETDTDAAARWEFLRRQMERIAERSSHEEARDEHRPRAE